MTRFTRAALKTFVLSKINTPSHVTIPLSDLLDPNPTLLKSGQLYFVIFLRKHLCNERSFIIPAVMLTPFSLAGIHRGGYGRWLQLQLRVLIQWDEEGGWHIPGGGRGWGATQTGGGRRGEENLGRTEGDCQRAAT